MMSECRDIKRRCSQCYDEVRKAGGKVAARRRRATHRHMYYATNAAHAAAAVQRQAEVARQI